VISGKTGTFMKLIFGELFRVKAWRAARRWRFLASARRPARWPITNDKDRQRTCGLEHSIRWRPTAAIKRGGPSRSSFGKLRGWI